MNSELMMTQNINTRSTVYRRNHRQLYRVALILYRSLHSSLADSRRAAFFMQKIQKGARTNETRDHGKALGRSEIGIKSMSSYLRKMALDGYCVNLDLTDVKEMISLIRRCSNNLNQYAKRANETGSIYAEDIKDVQTRLDEIWQMQKELMRKLYDLR